MFEIDFIIFQNKKECLYLLFSFSYDYFSSNLLSRKKDKSYAKTG